MKIGKYFGNIKMTWFRVILISIITGAIVGLLMIPKFLKGTSFQEPGITFEFWILFALFIVLNCEKPLEAGFKTFVAFLISQPVIYLVQVPFASLGWGLFGYYWYWFVLTLFTFPGGMIAWLVKKGSWLSVAVLSIANLMLCLMIPGTLSNAIGHFPNYSVAVLFMISEVVFFTLLLFKEKKKRVITFAVALIFLLASGIYHFCLRDTTTKLMIMVDGNGPFTVISENSRFEEVAVEGSMLSILYDKEKLTENGTEEIRYEDTDGVAHTIKIIIKDGNVFDGTTYND